ncbi:glycine hydroxymethyltransferase [Paragonimus westermani]|uniref:glycine hydroxymethyltransferase n=1 Tax=Paragonimus westermani TaxID=34504 RepID=A0A5J4P3Z2_9TREM|nr:glycine hydroxymethyltransferase [Paragonimus westermani]
MAICNQKHSTYRRTSIFLNCGCRETLLNIPKTPFALRQIESMTQSRLLELYKLKHPEQPLDACEWGVNVQPLSGSPANLAVYTALLQPNDCLMGLDYAAGGHASHGLATTGRKLSAAAIFFNSLPYKLDPKSETIDYDALESDAVRFLPKMIIAGVSTHPRLLDYARFRKICDSIGGAILLADMAHIAGLVAAGVVPSPFEYADVVTSTTHKTLRGPRAGLIFYRRQLPYSLKEKRVVPLDELETRINQAVFPTLQSGPHENVIAGIAAAAKEAAEPHFVEYASQVLNNCKALAKALMSRGIHLTSGGTDIHFLVVDLCASKITQVLGAGDASRVQVIADACGITLSAVPVPMDSDWSNPSGIRIGQSILHSILKDAWQTSLIDQQNAQNILKIAPTNSSETPLHLKFLGTPALTSRGFLEEHFEQIALFIEEVLKISDQTKIISNIPNHGSEPSKLQNFDPV